MTIFEPNSIRCQFIELTDIERFLLALPDWEHFVSTNRCMAQNIYGNKAAMENSVEISPVSFLENEFLRRKDQRSNYSLRQFAKKLNVSPGRLSEIFSHKRTLTPALAEKIANALDLSPKQADIFLRSTHLQQYQAPADMSSEFKKTLIREDVFNLIADWYHFAILNLMKTRGFDPKPSRIAMRLGISVIEVRQALQRMEKLKLIEKQGDGWIRSCSKLSTSWDVPSAALRKAHRQDLTMAIEALENVPTKFRDISSTTMAIDVSLLPKAKSLIRSFHAEMEQLLESGKQTEVYAFNIQLIPLTKEMK